MPSGTELRVFETIDSTNAEALRVLGNGYRGPCWFMARRQNAGRGRQGRRWISETGNLHASLLVPLNCAPEDVSQLSFVAALGVHDAVTAIIGAREESPGLALKWPNDVLLNGRKLAGILLETSSAAGRTNAAVIGVGLNLVHAPQIRGKPATSLAADNIKITPERALACLADCFYQRIGEWEQGKNFLKIREDWLSRAYGIGAKYMVNMNSEKMNGIFETIALDGAFILRLANGEAQRITSGEVRPVGGVIA